MSTMMQCSLCGAEYVAPGVHTCSPAFNGLGDACKVITALEDEVEDLQNSLSAVRNVIAGLTKQLGAATMSVLEFEAYVDILTEEIDGRREDILAGAHTPEWEQAGRVHTWQTYIPDRVRARWFDLNFELRVTWVALCTSRADKEEYE